MQAFDDLLPQFLIDNVNQTASSYHQVVQFI